MNQRPPRTWCCFLALMAALGASTAWAQSAAQAKDEVRAFTEPTKRSQMNFREIGIVKSVPVKEGQIVKKGDVLMVLDTQIEDAELERLKLEADSIARMEFAKADRDVKKAVYTRQSEKPGAFNPSEIEQAKLDWDRAEAQIKVVLEEQQAAAIRVKQQQAKLDKMVLRAEFDGVIEAIKIKEGELSSLDTDKPAIIVVQKDPLRVVITPLMATQVAKLELGETMQVRYDGETQWMEAKVIYKTPFADPASGTQTVWLEMPNSEQRDAGRRVFVKVPEKLLSTGTGVAAAPR